MRILGINHSNDAAAALVVDGRVIAASQEERFSRIKHDQAFPDKAIDFCLKTQGLKLIDLDALAFFWNPGIHAESPPRRLVSSVRHHLEYLYGVPAHLLSRLGEGVSSVDQIVHLASGRKLAIHYITHHLCHAAAAFFTSPFTDAAILTADGYGEHQSTTLYRGKGASIELVAEIDFPHSIGSFYAALTDYLGFRANSGEGKVMGLASYGSDSDYVAKMRKLVSFTERGFELDLSYFEYFLERPHRYSKKLVDLLGPPRVPESAVEKRHEDIAFALQTVTEEAMLHLARMARKLTGATNLCVAGGVALNCVANGRLQRETDFEKFFFYPAAGDTGTSVGAALVVEHILNQGKRSMEVASEYLGQDFTPAEVRAVLDRGQLRYHTLSAPELTAARMIADGRIVAWFQGRAEFGPRALGNRSILADPRRKDMKDLLNATVKFREPFRPYAPSVLEESCDKYFVSPVPSPYMLRAYPTRPEMIDVLPAITHVDGTARVQTVNEKQNPRYYRLIKEFGRITGVDCVLNTSFNIRGEPIINTVDEAIKCLMTTGLDALFVEDYLVVKDLAKVAPYLFPRALSGLKTT
jgi:carbamoyltransferase